MKSTSNTDFDRITNIHKLNRKRYEKKNRLEVWIVEAAVIVLGRKTDRTAPPALNLLNLYQASLSRESKEPFKSEVVKKTNINSVTITLYQTAWVDDKLALAEYLTVFDRIWIYVRMLNVKIVELYYYIYYITAIVAKLCCSLFLGAAFFLLNRAVNSSFG